MNNSYWSEKDITYLIENYPTLGKACASILERTPQAIYAKANKLGLTSKAARPSRAKTNEQYDADLLNNNIPILRIGDYISNRVRITHECSKGHRWDCVPSSVLSGQGCPYCAGNIKRTTDEFAKLTSFKVLGDYVNKETPILLECDQGHRWLARPGHITNSKSGCPECSTSGFDKNKPAICYYVKITKNNETYYKVGVTNRTVRDRFSSDRDKTILILKETWYATGREALEAEQAILYKFKGERQNITEFLRGRGNTELFEYDILNLDN